MTWRSMQVERRPKIPNYIRILREYAESLDIFDKYTEKNRYITPKVIQKLDFRLRQNP